MKKHSKWYLGGICSLLSLLVLAPLFAYWIVSSFILTPQKLKSILKTEVSQSVRGDFDFQSVELTYWETWPYVGVAIVKGTFSGPQDSNDRLSSGKPKLRTSFAKLTANINVLDFLKRKRITIKEISIDQPDIYVRTGDGNPFDFLRKNIADVRIRMDSLIQDLHFDVRNLIIQNGSMELEDIKHEIIAKWNGIDLVLSGEFSAADSDMSLVLNSDSSRIVTPDYTFTADFPIQAKCDLMANMAKRSVDVRSAKIAIHDIPFEVQGAFVMKSSQRLWMDASLTLSTTELKDLLGYAPPSLSMNLQPYKITGKTSLIGEFKGYLDGNTYPDILINGKLTDGSLFKKSEKYGLDTIALDFLFVCPSANPDSSVMEIKNLNVSGPNCYMNGQAKISNLTRSPFLDVRLKSDINFDGLGEELFNVDTMRLSGDLKSDLSLVFNLDDLRKGRYERIWADGSLDINHLRMHSDVYGLYVFASNIHGSMGYKQNRSHFIRQREVLGATLHADTLSFRHGQDLQLAISNLDISTNTGLQQDTTALTPVTTHLKVKKLQTRVQNDIAVVTSDMELHWGIKPSDKDKGQVAMAVAFTSDSLEFLSIHNQQATIVLGSQFISELYPKNTVRWNSFMSPQRLFQQCDMKGFLIFDRLRSFSRQFPLRVDVQGTKLGFKNNRLILNNAEIRAGKSDALVSGEILTFKKEGMKDRFIEGDLSVRSDYIDFNELKQAFLHGSNLEAERRPANSTAALLNIENLDKSIRAIEDHRNALDELTNELLVIPENVALSLSLEIKDMDMHEFNMREMKGTVSLKEKKALCDFSTHTNMGDTHVELLYKAMTSQKADVYLNWDMTRIQVGKLRKMFPAIETLFPMLNSIDGVLDCKLATYCPIDSLMNVDLNSLYAACSLDGENMVLFTNETFHQIADKLRFKDKDRNLIDRITVDFIAKDRMIDIFPFALDMDRYRFLVGGKHSMDMSFNYHIDVLKSPVPFNFGLNVDGKIGDFKYKLGKTKYTDTFGNPLQFEEFRMSKQRKMDEVKAGIMGAMRE